MHVLRGFKKLLRGLKKINTVLALYLSAKHSPQCFSSENQLEGRTLCELLREMTDSYLMWHRWRTLFPDVLFRHWCSLLDFAFLKFRIKRVDNRNKTIRYFTVPEDQGENSNHLYLPARWISFNFLLDATMLHSCFQNFTYCSFLWLFPSSSPG